MTLFEHPGDAARRVRHLEDLEAAAERHVKQWVLGPLSLFWLRDTGKPRFRFHASRWRYGWCVKILSWWSFGVMWCNPPWRKKGASRG